MFEQIARVRAHELVVQQLQERIMRGDLRAGDHLPAERELVAGFGISRATLREGLRVAESMGLIQTLGGGARAIVTAQPARGVARIVGALINNDVSTLAELVEVRVVLEGTAAFLAAGRSPQELQEVVGAYDDMRVADSFDSFVEADVRFHLATAEAARNAMLALITAALREPVADAIRVPLRRGGGERARELTLGRHGRVLEAMLAGNQWRARALSVRALYDNFSPVLEPDTQVRLESLVAAYEDGDARRA
ncbi:MAG: GntR family transcriptional regulator, transcriptional repressor for pyruvate dehydrogenase complex [Solirubrobacteraceae bacterium]